MDIQTPIVAIIITLALGFIFINLGRKVKSFSAKSNCGNDCGCDSSSKKLSQIQRK